MKNDPAFPGVKSQSGDFVDSPVSSVWSEGGLTKRELFAAMAMQGYLSRGLSRVDSVDFAVQAADALIAELER